MNKYTTLKQTDCFWKMILHTDYCCSEAKKKMLYVCVCNRLVKKWRNLTFGLFVIECNVWLIPNEYVPISAAIFFANSHDVLCDFSNFSCVFWQIRQLKGPFLYVGLCVSTFFVFSNHVDWLLMLIVDKTSFFYLFRLCDV